MFLKILLTFLCFYATSISNSMQNDQQKVTFERYWIGSTKLSAHAQSKRSIHQCEEFHLNLKNYATLHICVYRGNLRESNIINEEGILTVYEEDGSKTETLLIDMDYTTLTGYVIGQQKNSKADGYLDKDRFFGRISINETILYVEELVDYIKALNLEWQIEQYKNMSIIYENTITALNCSRPDLTFEVGHTKRKRRTNYTDFLRAGGDATADIVGKVCTLGVHVDTAYFKYSMGGNEEKTKRSVIESVKTANTIFRSSDFLGTGRPNNIGIEIKDFVIHKDSSKSPLPPFYPFLRNGIKLIQKFAENKHLLENVTLGVMFTGQKMTGNAVGWAFLPVIASNHYSPFATMNGICSLAPDGIYVGNNVLLVNTEDT